jgi:hypothetical protein
MGIHIRDLVDLKLLSMDIQITTPLRKLEAEQ